jgi:NADH-quinone oxidoreductase subunit E
MIETFSQIILYLIIGGVIGIVIGYMLGKNSCRDNLSYPTKEIKTSQSTKESSSTIPPQPIAVQPVLLSQAREGGKDNLQLIKGIGKVIERVLNEKGIYHFDQIASWTEAEVAWIDNAISFPGRAKRERWIEQAKQLSQGLETEFLKRVKAGKVNSK